MERYIGLDAHASSCTMNRKFKGPRKGGGRVGCGLWRGKQAASG
jgi:hypothetical protein